MSGKKKGTTKKYTAPMCVSISVGLAICMYLALALVMSALIGKGTLPVAYCHYTSVACVGFAGFVGTIIGVLKKREAKLLISLCTAGAMCVLVFVLQLSGSGALGGMALLHSEVAVVIGCMAPAVITRRIKRRTKR